MFKLRKVTGNSMLPALDQGDFVIIIKCRPQIGDIVVAKHSKYGEIIKRVSKINSTGYELSGDNNKSINSKKIGFISPKNILGKVLLRF